MKSLNNSFSKLLLASLVCALPAFADNSMVTHNAADSDIGEGIVYDDDVTLPVETAVALPIADSTPVQSSSTSTALKVGGALAAVAGGSVCIYKKACRNTISKGVTALLALFRPAAEERDPEAFGDFDGDVAVNKNFNSNYPGNPADSYEAYEQNVPLSDALLNRW
jgi:hypothetical protein